MDDLTRLFSAYDRGTISRRQLLQALGLAAVSAPLARAFGQGPCAGRDATRPPLATRRRSRRRSSRPDWKTVLLDHFNMQVTDAEREAAFYAAFLGWKVRSNDGNEIYMDIGDWGGVKIRGGYVAAPAAAGGRGGGGRRRGSPVARGDSAGGGRGGGGGGGGGAAADATGRREIRATWPRATTPQGCRAVDERRRALGRFLLGHRAVGHEQGRSGAQGAWPQSRRRSPAATTFAAST